MLTGVITIGRSSVTYLFQELDFEYPLTTRRQAHSHTRHLRNSSHLAKPSLDIAYLGIDLPLQLVPKAIAKD